MEEMKALEFTVVEVTTPVTLFRLIQEDRESAPLVQTAFRSNYELNAAPRKVEVRSAAIHMGISTVVTAEVARSLATRWRAMGPFVGRLELTPGHGFSLAQTGFPGHWTVWGRPADFAACLAGIERV
jgi:hypothetical protein